MSEPVMLGAISSATSVFSGFTQHFKPSRSPYLLSGLLAVLSLLGVAGIPQASKVFLFAFFPLAAIFTFLSILCFFFKPYKGTTVEEAQKAEEIDEQFKFSRTVCLSVGVLLLTYLLFKVVSAPVFELPGPPPPRPPAVPTGLFFWIAYIACIMHLIIFGVYTIFRSIREDSAVRLSLFQITFFTVALLVGIVFSCTKLYDQNGFLISCHRNIQFSVDEEDKSAPIFGCPIEVLNSEEQRIKTEFPNAKDFSVLGGNPSIDPNKVLFWYFLVHFAFFELYWIKRLISVVRFRVDLVILE